MASQISRMLPLLVITLFCIGVVEGGYTLLEYFLLRRPAQESIVPPAAATEERQVNAGGKRDTSIILTRNLFGQQLEPEEKPPSPVVDVADMAKTDLDVVLVGTIGDSEGTHRAIILDKKSRKQELYKEGDEINGTNIKEILRGKVILDVEGKEELLDMSEAATVRPAVRVPPELPFRPGPQAGGRPVPVQPEARVEPQPPEAAGIAPGAEGSPGAVEEPPVETAPEAAPEEVAPEEGIIPEAAPEVAPEAPPEAAPPAEEQQTPESRIVRPRIIRPSRSY